MMMQSGPGGRGSIPALVMRTGLIQPVDPANARRDVQSAHVRDVTHWPTDQMPSPDDTLPPPMPMSTAPQVSPIPSPPGPLTTAVAQTVAAVPPTPITNLSPGPMPRRESDRHHWHHQHRGIHPMAAEIQRLHPTARLHGADDILLGEWNGKPVAKFEIAASPPANGAQGAIYALRDAARKLVQGGLAALPPELVGGPLAALMRGGAIELHFQNGVVARTAL
jgi:hypothetical protein